MWTGDTPEAGEAIWRLCETAIGPWREGPTLLGGDENLIVRSREVTEELWKYHEVMGVPDMLYLHRTLAGLYTMARRLEVRHDWGQMLDGYLSFAIEVAEGRDPEQQPRVT